MYNFYDSTDIIFKSFLRFCDQKAAWTIWMPSKKLALHMAFQNSKLGSEIL